MASGPPGQHGGFGGDVNCRWIGVRHAEPSHMRAFRIVVAFDIADVAITVLLEIGMKCERVDLLHAGDLLSEIHDQVGCGDIGLVRKREDFSRLLHHQQAIASRDRRQLEALLEFERGKHLFGDIRQRWLGRSHDSRCRPRRPLLDADLLRTTLYNILNFHQCDGSPE